MKIIPALFVWFLITSQSIAQQHFAYRRDDRLIHLKTDANGNSVIPLNDQYYLMEDSCAQIIRYAHVQFKNRIFTGKIKDVSKVDTNLVVTEGNYTDEGLKDGKFILHYLNGNLRAKGNFKNNKYDGHWELYYDNGKPQLTFDAVNNDIAIVDAWGVDGKKTVDNGKGEYKENIAGYYWFGKILNGKPDGSWKYVDERNVSVTLVSEYFKKGRFHDGTGPLGDYKDTSRLILPGSDLLPLAHTERFVVSPIACNGTGRRRYVNAQYADGAESFKYEIETAVTPVLQSIRGRLPDGSLVIEGFIDTKGILTDLKPTSFNYDPLGQRLADKLYKVPALQPATSDGIPVKEKFSIIFVFENGLYSYRYRFSKLETDK